MGGWVGELLLTCMIWARMVRMGEDQMVWGRETEEKRVAWGFTWETRKWLMLKSSASCVGRVGRWLRRRRLE